MFSDVLFMLRILHYVPVLVYVYVCLGCVLFRIVLCLPAPLVDVSCSVLPT